MKTNTSKILRDLKNHLFTNYCNSVQDVILFGSHLYNNSNKFSNYDVLIVLNQAYSGQDENKILDLCYDIDLKHDIHIISTDELTSIRGKQPLYANAIKSGIYA